jgi:hypothetical protein
MHPIARKVGAYVTLCSAACFFACLGTRAQDRDLSISPVDSSVQAGVDEINIQTKDLPPPANTTKQPQMLSRWSPQAVKQLPQTTLWSGRAKVANPPALTGSDSDLVPYANPDSKASQKWSGLNNSTSLLVKGEVSSRSFDERYGFVGTLPPQMETEQSTRPEIFPILPAVTSFQSVGMPSSFDQNTFGQMSRHAFPRTNVFPSQLIRKKPVDRPRQSVPALHIATSTDSQSNPKP